MISVYTSHTKLPVQSGSIYLSLYAHGQMVRDIASVDDLEEIDEEILLASTNYT